MAPKSKGKRGFRGSMIQEAQPKTARVDNRPARSVATDIGPELERKWFQFDRTGVIRQIDIVQGAIDANAKELGMVAVEGVFEKSLSDELLRTSQALNVIARELRALRGQVERSSSYPKADKKRS